MRHGQRLLEHGPRIEVDVEDQRIGAFAAHGAWHAMTGAGDHARGNARNAQLRNLAARNVAIARGLHLVLRRQVEPQLKALHAAVFLLGHLTRG
jgi:hypothetical protein